MKPARFAYQRVSSVTEAVQILAERGTDATLLAGGQSLVPMMNLRLSAPSMLVDVFHLQELRYMHRTSDALRVGAMTTQRQLETAHDGELDGFGILREAASWVGHYPIRTRATIGGSIAHADPAAEMPLLAVLLDAELVLAGRSEMRSVPAAQFFEGFFTTARRPHEMLVEIRFPRPVGQAALVEHARRRGDFGLVLVAAVLDYDGEICRSARLAVGGVGAVPLRLHAIERELIGRHLDNSVIRDAAGAVGEAINWKADAHVTAAYRRELAVSLVRHCLRRLTGEAIASPKTGVMT